MNLSALKYISEKRERDFNKLNIYTCEDLIRHYPRDLLDLRKITPLKYAYHNDTVLTACEVMNVEVNRHARRPYVKAFCQQGGYIFTAVWFNQPYVAEKLKSGDYLFYGRVQNKYGLGCSMVNPTFEKREKNRNLKGFVPVYSLSGSLTQGIVRTAIRQALDKVEIRSSIPYQIIKRYNLMPLSTAYRLVHEPQEEGDFQHGSERIALEEYFLLISAFNIIKGGREDVRINRYSTTFEDVLGFCARYPFEFTQGQKTAVEEIYRNLTSPHNMNRLLQGDVGSGKTAVAFSAIYVAVASGFQAAMIAPTEVLARQNAQLLAKYFPEFKVAALTGSCTAAEKREIKSLLKSGEINIVCGTHAVIQKDVVFKNLSLVVCDEQHRFGVAQRSSLSEKGEGCDVLVMSATPIPRTLSLIFYGDLDITTISDKPHSRQEITTAVIAESKYADMYRYVKTQAERGFQTYFVCPKIEGDEEGSTASVTELFDELKAKLPDLKIALLHGKMKDKEKNEIMQNFKDRQFDCLVSTTVIEVGVDVPNATTMIIYNAERFGLSQLHQLRGRVGRGEEKSYCFLLMGTDSEIARERLSIIKSTNDGFKIAESDLKFRGGGDLLGTRQSGRVLSEIKNLKFPVGTIFTAKKLSDEAFSGGLCGDDLVKIAMKKYESLKDVVLN